jgi:hypothetical protein
VRRLAAEEVVRVLNGQAPVSPVNADHLVDARAGRELRDRATSAIMTHTLDVLDAELAARLLTSHSRHS